MMMHCHRMIILKMSTFWRLLCSYLSTAAISLSSLYARALGTMLWRSSWFGACSDSARLTPGRSSLSCIPEGGCEHIATSTVYHTVCTWQKALQDCALSLACAQYGVADCKQERLLLTWMR